MSVYAEPELEGAASALKTAVELYGKNSSEVAEALRRYIDALRLAGQHEEADRFEKHQATILQLQELPTFKDTENVAAIGNGAGVPLSLEEAERELQNAQETLGSDNPVLAQHLQNVAKLLRERNLRLLEASNMETRAKVILAKAELQTASQSQSPPESTPVNKATNSGTVVATPVVETTTAEEMKRCPYCAESIRVEAILCRFCRMDLQTPQSPSVPQPQARRKLCPHCHQMVNIEAVLCKFCKSSLQSGMPANVSTGKSGVGMALGIASLLIGFYAGTSAPYFSAVYLVPLALVLGLVGLALGNRLASIAGILLSLFMFQVLAKQQSDMDGKVRAAQHQMEKIQQDSQDLPDRYR